ncbi:MAG: hypothetical protein DI607_14160 [Sphingomonas hengshuiensis]|nr:MAG: hypothetical protein DI607_14160 [Sphingomonas hengshuiensis]
MLRVTLTTLFAVLLAACGRSDAPGATDAGKPAASKVIKLGATAGCFADQIRWGIQPILEKKGYTIELTEFSDYIQPNIALAEGSLDANTFEHVVYLEKFASERKLAIQPLTQVPTAPLGLYSHKHQSLDELADGARIALPNDPTNQARALVMLEKLGWLTLKPDVDPIRASEKDVATNPRKLELLPLEAAQLPRLGRIDGQRGIAVDDLRAEPLPVVIQRLRVEQRVLALSQERAHRQPAEDQRRWRRRRIEGEMVRIDAHRQVVHTAAVERCEQRLEPFVVFVDDGDIRSGRHCTAPVGRKPRVMRLMARHAR